MPQTYVTAGLSPIPLPIVIEATSLVSCLKGGFPSIRHNEVRDITASLLSEVCHNVAIEPHLQPLSGKHMNLLTANTDTNAHLDIAADGVWGGRFKRSYFDVRVFNPFCSVKSANTLGCHL